MSFDFKALCE